MKRKEYWYIYGSVSILIAILLGISLIPGIKLISEQDWRFFISIPGPLLAFIAFIRTLQVQILLNKKDDKNAIRADFFELLKLMNDYKKSIEVVAENIYDIVKDRYNTLNEFPYETVYLKYSSQFKEISPFFRCFHRILKNLNEAYESGTISHKEYKGYISILRTQFKPSELEFILYNSVIMHRGTGLGIELIGTSFFGDKSDVLINQHLDYQKYFKNELLDKFVDKDSDNLLVKNQALERKEMRKIYQKIVNRINTEVNEKKRIILVNRLTSMNLRKIDTFNFVVTDEETSKINF
ncbi:putative phage abortive infection protein [Virgibacillus halodenitrificans]|uniref:Phage abortive infection protein n=1 Tax=Virgibacillus halodenitrificans TaxID=1482 RepID=A0ABR7VNR1_VIRHA|nr:putative phage abortive infection protein [Virgibacillus halodenitrificans]MBD1223283.1 hypothetical protein [Virgibacillus halodenitrificans]